MKRAFIRLLIIISGIVISSQAWPREILLGVHSFNPLKSTPSGGMQIDLVRQLGMKVVRIGVSWRRMELTRGEYAPGFWNGLENALTQAERNGLKVIIVLSESPCWASTDPKKNCNNPDESQTHDFRYPPENPVDYANALRKLVKRFGHRVYAWEIWNEPNTYHFWRTHNSRNYDGFWPETIQNRAFLIEVEAAARYVELLKVAYAAIKDMQKSAIVLGGSLAGADTFYLNAMYQAGARGTFDALALHPYSAVTDTGTVDGVEECNKPPWCYKKGVEEIRRLMLDVYDDDKPIWFTELGVSSFAGWGGITEQQQTGFLAEALELMQGWEFVPVAIWYNLIDLNRQTTREGGFGLYRHNLTLKPVGQLFKSHLSKTVQQTTLLPGAPQGTINHPSPRFYWDAAEGATEYLIWANEHGTIQGPVDDTLGKIQNFVTPQQASCSTDNSCSAAFDILFMPGDNQWWVTAYFADGSSQLSSGTSFIVNNPVSRDSDNDSVIDEFDNCVFTRNPDQRDTDNDQIGNRCDPDFNNDGQVDQTDYDYFRVMFNSQDQDADLNGDRRVDIHDEVTLKSMLNTRPGPSCCSEALPAGLWGANSTE